MGGPERVEEFLGWGMAEQHEKTEDEILEGQQVLVATKLKVWHGERGKQGEINHCKRRAGY